MASLFSQQASFAQEAKKEAPAKAAETQPAVNPADNPGGEVAKAATALPAAAAQPVPLSDRLRSLFGVVLILGVCYAFSSNRKIISRRIVFWGLTLQWIMAYLVLSNPYGQNALKWTGSQIEKVLACSYKGSEFLFGAEAINPAG
ncbi:MAG: Na+ dependent nucleoside transporter N-terminal domain-containing protein, partial [Planctomycetota bacterium]